MMAKSRGEGKVRDDEERGRSKSTVPLVAEVSDEPLVVI